MARLLHTNPNYISNLFGRCEGISFTDFVLREKITLSFSGDKNTLRLKLDTDILDGATDAAAPQGSLKLSFEPPRYTTENRIIWAFGAYVVWFCFWLDFAKPQFGTLFGTS